MKFSWIARLFPPNNNLERITFSFISIMHVDTMASHTHIRLLSAATGARYYLDIFRRAKNVYARSTRNIIGWCTPLGVPMCVLGAKGRRIFWNIYKSGHQQGQEYVCGVCSPLFYLRHGNSFRCLATRLDAGYLARYRKKHSFSTCHIYTYRKEHIF